MKNKNKKIFEKSKVTTEVVEDFVEVFCMIASVEEEQHIAETTDDPILSAAIRRDKKVHDIFENMDKKGSDPIKHISDKRRFVTSKTNKARIRFVRDNIKKYVYIVNA